MQTKHNNLRVLTAVVLIAMAPPSVESAEFDFWYGNSGRAEQAIIELCDQFNATQSEHRINCVGHGSYEATLQKTVSAYRAKKHPALVQVLDVGTAEMSVSVAYVPVQKLKVGQHAIIEEQNFVGSTLDYYRSHDGDAMSIPFSTSTLVLYVNDTKLQAAGIERAPKTWEEFGETLRVLRDAGESCPWTFRIHPWYHLEQFSAIHGIDIATHHNGLTGLGSEYTFATGQHQRFMQDVKRWYDNNLAMLQENLSIANGARAFGIGDCAMLLESTGVYSAIRAAAAGRFDFSVHQVPIYSNSIRHSSLVGGASLWSLKGFSDEQYSAIAEFVSFLLRPKNQAELTRSTGFLPLTVEGYQEVRRRPGSDHELDQLLAVARSSLEQNESNRPTGVRLGFYAQFRRIWIEELQKAFANSISIDEALLNAEQRGNRLLRRFERMHAPETQ